MKMPKSVTILAAMAFTFSAHAVDFNVDAMKELQDKGVKLAEHAEDLQRLAVGQGGQQKCLQVAGALTKEGQGIKAAPCNQEKSQQWRFDDQGRLVSAGGTCLGFKGDPGKAGIQLKTEACGKGNRHVWTLGDGLTNTAGLCLDASGGAPVIKPCKGDVPMQKWRFIEK